MCGLSRRRLTAVPPQFTATSRQLHQSSPPQPTTHRRWRSRRSSGKRRLDPVVAVAVLSAAEAARTAQGGQDAAASAPSSCSPTQPSPLPPTPLLSLQGRHLACAGRISVTATRPTAAAATAPGRETSCPGRCTRRPPGQTGFPQGSVIRRPLLSRYWRYSIHHPWPNFFWWPGTDHRHWCRADSPTGLQRQQVPFSQF